MVYEGFSWFMIESIPQIPLAFFVNECDLLVDLLVKMGTRWYIKLVSLKLTEQWFIIMVPSFFFKWQSVSPVSDVVSPPGEERKLLAVFDPSPFLYFAGLDKPAEPQPLELLNVLNDGGCGIWPKKHETKGGNKDCLVGGFKMC